MKIKKCCACGKSVKVDGYEGFPEPHRIWEQNGIRLCQCWECYEAGRNGTLSDAALPVGCVEPDSYYPAAK